ncbi:MAG: hypothetical protein Q8M64_10245 [Methyloversatilis sp.]|nr:hypothetical protein [Methyloversatilis sp.]
MKIPAFLRSPAAAELAIRVLILAATVLMIRACLLERATLGTQPSVGTNRQLIIAPTDGFPSLFLNRLRTRLTEQHKFEVLITVPIALPRDTEIGSSGQHDLRKIAEAGYSVCQSQSVGSEYCVVLTNLDINLPDSGLRYLFAQHYRALSIVSVARLSEANFGAKLNLVSTPIIARAVALGCHRLTEICHLTHRF